MTTIIFRTKYQGLSQQMHDFQTPPENLLPGHLKFINLNNVIFISLVNFLHILMPSKEIFFLYFLKYGKSDFNSTLLSDLPLRRFLPIKYLGSMEHLYSCFKKLIFLL